MSLEKILSIGGKPGLFKLISHAKNHIIVESLENQKKFPITGTHQINTLDNISIYTHTKEIPLAEVLYAIYTKEDGKECLAPNENSAKLSAYFSEVLPEYDPERVYASHIKKILQWYLLLRQSGYDFKSLENLNPDESDTTA